MFEFQASDFGLKKTTAFNISYITPRDTIVLADGSRVVDKAFNVKSENIGRMAGKIGQLEVNVFEVRGYRNAANPYVPNMYGDTTGNGQGWIKINSAIAYSRAGPINLQPAERDTVKFVPRGGSTAISFVGPVYDLDSSWCGPLKVTTMNGDSVNVKEAKLARDKNDVEPTGYYIWFKRTPTATVWELVNNISGERPSGITSVKGDKKGGIPVSFELKGIFPNPFNPTTTIEISLAKSMDVKLNIYDATGKKVAEVFDGKLTPGDHEFNVNLAGMSSGIYFFNVKTPEGSVVAKALLVK